ncbi:TerD family protein [Xanthomonas phage XaC1]|nr:TerD family protein [Xanthomonas phage XaC1]
MSFTLDKGSKLNLDKFEASGLNVLRVEMNWDAPEKTSSHFKTYDYDLDAVAFIIDKNEKAIDNYKHFCFFKQPNTPAILSSGDDLNGKDGGESLLITLANVPTEGTQIPIIVDLHKAAERKQNLSQMKSGTVQILNHETDEVLCTINMSSFSSSDTSILCAMVNRTSSGFDVENISLGFDKGLGDWVKLYGIDLTK